MISAHDVLTIVAILRAARVRVWLDGGWGIDALIGEQTRDHDDLDCVIALSDAQAAIAALASRGYRMNHHERPARFVLRDGFDRRVDFHTVTFDADGGGVQSLQDGTRWRYPPHGFRAVGRIAGEPLPSLSADVQMLAHVAYEPIGKDFHEMRLLAEHVGTELPAKLRRCG
jgi:lincosamide nucleotidyltransferase A/C/D/E